MLAEDGPEGPIERAIREIVVDLTVLGEEQYRERQLLENYYLPGDLERSVHRFVENYNHARCHESLGNLTPADVYFGRATKILKMREKIKRDTIQQRRLTHFKTAA